MENKIIMLKIIVFFNNNYLNSAYWVNAFKIFVFLETETWNVFVLQLLS